MSMIAIGFASGASAFGCWFYLLDHSPSVPVPLTGQICPCNNHGHIFYVTEAQDTILDGLMFAFMSFWGGGILLGLWWKVPYHDLTKKEG